MAYKLCMKNVNKFNFDIGNPLPLGWVGPLFWDKVLEKSLIRNSCSSVSKKQLSTDPFHQFNTRILGKCKTTKYQVKLRHLLAKMSSLSSVSFRIRL